MTWIPIASEIFNEAALNWSVFLSKMLKKKHIKKKTDPEVNLIYQLSVIQKAIDWMITLSECTSS